MARKPQTQSTPQVAPASQADVTFTQLVLVTMQIYGNCTAYSGGSRKPH